MPASAPAYLVHCAVDLDVHIVTQLVICEVGAEGDEALLPAPQQQRGAGGAAEVADIALLPPAAKAAPQASTAEAAHGVVLAPEAARERIARPRAITLAARHFCSFLQPAAATAPISGCWSLAGAHECTAWSGRAAEGAADELSCALSRLAATVCSCAGPAVCWPRAPISGCKGLAWRAPEVPAPCAAARCC